MDVEMEEQTQTSNGDQDTIDSKMVASKVEDMKDEEDDTVHNESENSMSSEEANHNELHGDEDDANNLEGGDSCSKDAPIESDAFSEEPKNTDNASKSTPTPVKVKKRRRSSAFNTSLSDPPGETSFYGRTRRSKVFNIVEAFNSIHFAFLYLEVNNTAASQ